MKDKNEWWLYEDKVIELIEWMIENCMVEDKWEETRYILEKPYKYEEEWEMYKEYLKETCDHGYNEKGVCAFCGKKE